ncbi:hypothetical protein CXG50_22880 [Pseudomonas plecoglossicida]|nr:hypothetical protein CX682_18265 [Pseudomonas sp. FFUP_PS_41]PLU97747.1 hypothetical protein CXG52_13245 [Pseudomonas plecoglossicida]PLV04781.1 hypothetical protein CXG50_22880 [Pseudomonas plecoglossicida]RFP98859.1 hypothetical protein D0O09_25935 [Pseudomonas putida]TXI03866.1 MAG: hypothetical protein E6Q70_14690 [Pseudomonas monteilii]
MVMGTAGSEPERLVLWILCLQVRPHRRQAGSHRYCTGLESPAIPVGAGLPAMGCKAAPRPSQV